MARSALSSLLVLLMISSIIAPAAQAQSSANEEPEEENSLFDHHTPIIDALSTELQWSFARERASLEHMGPDVEHIGWTIVTTNPELLLSLIHI